MSYIEYNKGIDALLKKVPALKAGEKAVYELNKEPTSIGSVDEKGRTTELPMYSASENLTSRQRLSYSGKEFQLGYIVNQKMAGPVGKQQLVPVFGKIEFLGDYQSQLTVGSDNTGLYNFLELNPYNLNNVLGLPSPSGRYLFKRVQPELDAKGRLDLLRKIAKLHNALDALSEKAVLDLARDLDVPTGGEPSQVLERLFELAKQAPERVQSALSEEVSQTRTLLREAEELGIIAWSPDGQVWKLCENGQVITAGLPGKESIEALVTYVSANTAGLNFRRLMATAVAARNATK